MCNGEGVWPLVCLLDAGEEFGKPLESKVGYPSKVLLCPCIETTGRGWAMRAGILEVLPSDGLNGLCGCFVYVLLVFGKESVDHGADVGHVAVVHRVPSFPNYLVNLVGV